MTRGVKYETKHLYDGEVICLTDCPYNIDDNEDDVCKTKIGSVYCTESCRYYKGKIERNNEKFVLCNYEEEK